MGLDFSSGCFSFFHHSSGNSGEGIFLICSLPPSSTVLGGGTVLIPSCRCCRFGSPRMSKQGAAVDRRMDGGGGRDDRWGLYVMGPGGS